MQLPIRGLVFDLSGVLFTQGTQVASDKLISEGEDPGIVKKIFRGEKSQLLRTGKIAPEEFWNWVKVNFKSIDAKKYRDAWLEGFHLDQDLLQLIIYLRGQYETIVFSGTTKERANYLQGKYLYENYFDHTVYSFQIGANKDSTEMYEALIKGIEGNPEQYIVVDDSKQVTKLAQAHGLKAIQYSTLEQLKKSLDKIGVRHHLAFTECTENETIYQGIEVAEQIGWVKIERLFLRGDRLRPAREISTYLNGSYKSITPSIKEMTSTLTRQPKLQPEPIWISKEDGKWVVYEGRHRILAATLAGRTYLLAKKIGQDHEKVLTQKKPSYKNYYQKPLISSKEFLRIHQDAD